MFHLISAFFEYSQLLLREYCHGNGFHPVRWIEPTSREERREVRKREREGRKGKKKRELGTGRGRRVTKRGKAGGKRKQENKDLLPCVHADKLCSTVRHTFLTKNYMFSCFSINSAESSTVIHVCMHACEHGHVQVIYNCMCMYTRTRCTCTHRCITVHACKSYMYTWTNLYVLVSYTVL